MCQASLSRPSYYPSATTFPFHPGLRGLGGVHEGCPRGSVQGPSVRLHRDPRGSIFVLCSQRQGLVARWRLGKPLVARPRRAWGGRPCLACLHQAGPGFVCGAARAWGFLSLCFLLTSCTRGIRALLARRQSAPARRSRGSLAPGPPTPRPSPASLAPYFLGGNNSACMPQSPAAGRTLPRRFWSPLDSPEAASWVAKARAW